MSNRLVLAIALFGAVCIIPVQAQNQNEEGQFNFSMGGG